MNLLDIDPEPSPAELAAARALIATEAQNTSPPTLPPLKEPSFSPAVTTELARVASKQPSTPLDLSRYEAPSTTIPPPLASTAVSSSYLSSRLTHLTLLDKYGRNAWLLGNHALEAELAALERELAGVKREVDVVNVERRKRQEGVRGEMESLGEGWRRGVGRVLETELAVEEVRERVREELRRRAAEGRE